MTWISTWPLNNCPQFAEHPTEQAAAEHAKQLRATSYAMRARRLWLDVVIGWNQGAAERLERRVRLHRRRERRARDEYSKTPTTSAKCCICGEAASRVFQTPGLRACGQTPYCDQHAADLLARANRPRPTSTTARCAPQRRGCCTLCEGTGGEGAGACWDCRGTGHPHRPDPGCCERVRR